MSTRKNIIKASPVDIVAFSGKKQRFAVTTNIEAPATDFGVPPIAAGVYNNFSNVALDLSSAFPDGLILQKSFLFGRYESTDNTKPIDVQAILSMQVPLTSGIYTTSGAGAPNPAPNANFLIELNDAIGVACEDLDLFSPDSLITLVQLNFEMLVAWSNTQNFVWTVIVEMPDR